LHFEVNIFYGKADRRGSTLKTAVFDIPLRMFFSTKPTHVLQKTFSSQIFHFLTNFQAKYIPNKGRTYKKWSQKIVENRLKISNLLSEARFHDAELTSILWREKFS
jgi:hypothetical protein